MHTFTISNHFKLILNFVKKILKGFKTELFLSYFPTVKKDISFKQLTGLKNQNEQKELFNEPVPIEPNELEIFLCKLEELLIFSLAKK